MPSRLRDIVRVARDYDIEFEPGKGTSHNKMRKDGEMFVLAGKLKSEIADFYVRKFCRRFNIDYDEFKAKL